MYLDKALNEFWRGKNADVFFSKETSAFFVYEDNPPVVLNKGNVDKYSEYRWDNKMCYAIDSVYIFTNAQCDGKIYSWDQFSKICIVGFSPKVDQDRFVVRDLLHTIFQYRLLNLNSIAAHASVAVYNNEGVLFCGMPSAGKSTQANLWKEFVGAWILNYDKPALSAKESKEIWVSGTPWSGKEDCYVNEEVKVKAIIFVKKASSNSVRLLSKAEAYATVYPNFMPFPICNDLAVAYENILQEFLTTLPVYELSCTPDERAVLTLFSELYGLDAYTNARSKYMVRYRIKEGFLLKCIADEYIVIARGEHALKFSATILLNETGAVIWKALREWKSKDELVDCLLCEYNVSLEIATSDVEIYIKELLEANVLEKKQ